MLVLVMVSIYAGGINIHVHYVLEQPGDDLGLDTAINHERKRGQEC